MTLHVTQKYQHQLILTAEDVRWSRPFRSLLSILVLDFSLVSVVHTKHPRLNAMAGDLSGRQKEKPRPQSGTSTSREELQCTASHRRTETEEELWYGLSSCQGCAAGLDKSRALGWTDGLEERRQFGMLILQVPQGMFAVKSLLKT